MSAANTSVYADTDVCRWHLNQINVSGNLAVFHVPFPYEHNFSNKIQQAVRQYERVAVLCSELHRQTVDFIRANQYPNLQYFTCGFIKDQPTELWMDWFDTTATFYKHSSLLGQLSPYAVKDKLFDVLLGQPRPHRDIVYNYVRNNLNQEAIVTYTQTPTLPVQDTENWIWGITKFQHENIRHTVATVTYDNQQVRLSQLIPVNIYNQTAYTVVTETNAENDFNFYTEKIVKPILARRLFLVFAGQHYLKNLRKLGFKTFNGIIDENYDTVADQQTRFSMVFDEMSKLTRMPQAQVLDQISPIVEHNYSVMMETNWLGQMHTVLKQHLTADSTCTLRQLTTVQLL